VGNVLRPGHRDRADAKLKRPVSTFHVIEIKQNGDRSAKVIFT
jgi:hypothetical protein